MIMHLYTYTGTSTCMYSMYSMQCVVSGVYICKQYRRCTGDEKEQIESETTKEKAKATGGCKEWKCGGGGGGVKFRKITLSKACMQWFFDRMKFALSRTLLLVVPVKQLTSIIVILQPGNWWLEDWQHSSCKCWCYEGCYLTTGELMTLWMTTVVPW